MKILAFDGGMSVRSMCTIMYGASDSRDVIDFSLASLIVACVCPFCVRITASDLERNCVTRLRDRLLPRPRPPSCPASSYMRGWRNTVTSILGLPNPRSFRCMPECGRVWPAPSRASRPLLPSMIASPRAVLPLPPKHSRASTIMTGIDGAYSLEFISRHRPVVIIDEAGRSYPNILM